jgi:hypothetical protein
MKRIDKFKVGDKVVAYNPNRPTHEFNPITGTIKGPILSPSDRPAYKIEMDSGLIRLWHEHYIIPEDIYNSPLYQAMQE